MVAQGDTSFQKGAVYMVYFTKCYFTISISKESEKNPFSLVYRITAKGQKAFTAYVEALKGYLEVGDK